MTETRGAEALRRFLQTEEDNGAGGDDTPIFDVVGYDLTYGDLRALVRALLAENQWLDREAAQWQSAFERLHARVHRDFNFDAAESAAPDDEYWARLMDDLVIYADEVHPEIETGTVPSSTDNERR